MSVDWNGYVIFDPGVLGPLHELSRSEARAAFERLMAEKRSRIMELKKLLHANGIELDETDESIQKLNDWFRAEVTEDANWPGRLEPKWYSVVNDIGLLLGDTMIRRNPGLRWEFATRDRRGTEYQRHVITGFDIPNPRYNVDPDMAVATYGHRVVAGLPVENDEFCRMIRYR